MDNTKGKIDYILSKRGKDRLLAACFFVIASLSCCVVVLYFQNGRLHDQMNDLVIKNQQQRIEDLRRQNDYLFGLTKQVDSAKAALQIFKIQKEMK